MGVNRIPSSKNNSRDSSPIVDINVTPLVDVLLVLIVVFVLASGAYYSSLGVNLSKSQQASKKEKQAPPDKHKAIVLGITSEGVLRWRKETFNSVESFLEFFEKEGQKQKEVYLQVDEKLPSGQLLGIMEKLKEKYFESLSLVSKR